MKKQFTLLSGLLLFAGVSFSQNALKVPSAKLAKDYNTIAPYNGEIKNETNGNTKALGALLWSSDFSNPSDWSISSSGQGAFEIGNGAPALTQYLGAMASTTASNGFAFFNAVQYLIAGNVDPQNTSIETQPIDFTGNDYAEISFQQRYRAFNTDVTYVEFSPDGGTTWTITEQINADVVTNDPSVQNTISLVFYVDNVTNGVFRFRWENPSSDDQFGSGYGWAIDDVEVRELSDYDLVSTYNFHHSEFYQYTQIPVAQIAPIDVVAGIRNDGSQSLTNVKLVLGDAATDESPEITLAPFQKDTLVATFTPASAVGNYTVTRTLSMTETDDKPLNNSLPNITYSITDHIYAVDRGAPFSDYPLTSLVDQSNNPITIEGVGNSFDIVTDQDIHGINFRFFTGTAIDAEVYGELYEFDPSASQISDLWVGPLSETEMFTVTSVGQVSSIHTLRFSDPYTLEAGKTYLVLVRFAGSSVIKFAAAGTTTTSQSWIRVQGSQVWGTFSTIPVVRANFDPTLGLAENDVVNGVSVFPNPATDKTSVEFNLANASSVSVVVTDVTGKTVETLNLGNVAAGVHTADLNTANFAAGLYSVAIKTNDSSVTRKLVVQ